MKQNRTKLVRIAAFLIPIIAVIIGFISGGFAPFGGKDVMTAGGLSNYIVFFEEFHDRLFSGQSLAYSLRQGLGYDFTTIITYYLSDPTNLLIVLLPKSAMLAAINIMYMIKVGLAGLFFSIFLSDRKERLLKKREAMEETRKDEIATIEEKKAAKKKAEREKAEAKAKKATGSKKNAEVKKDIKIGGSEDPKSAFGKFIQSIDFTNIALSVAYALSSYMLGLGLNVTWLGAVCLFPLIIMGLDKLIHEKAWKQYTLTLLISFFLNFYVTLMISIFMGLYFVLQDYKNFRHFARSCGYKLMSDVLAMGGASLVIMNNWNSELFKSQISLRFPFAAFSTTFFDVIKMMLPGAMPSAIDTCANGIDIFCSISVVFLLLCYIFNKNINTISKIKNTSMVVLLFLGTFFTTPNYLFNGLMYSDYNFVAFGFILVFVLLTILYEELVNKAHTLSIHLNIAGLISGALVVLSMLFAQSYNTLNPFLTALEFIFIYYILFILWKNDSMTKLLFKTVFALFIMGEIVIQYVTNLSLLGNESKVYTDTLESKYYLAEQYIHNNDPKAKILEYKYMYSESNPLSNAILGYDYILKEHNEDPVDSLLEFIDTRNGIDIYQNPYSLKNGFFVSGNVAEWDYSRTYPFASYNTLVNEFLMSDEIFTPLTGEFYYSPLQQYDENANKVTSVSPNSYVFTPDKGGDIYVFLAHMIHLGEYESGSRTSFIYTFTNREIQNTIFSAQYVAFKKDNFLNLFDTISVPETAFSINKNAINYDIRFNADKDGYLLLPISFNDNWTVSGTPLASDIICKDNTLTLIPIVAGANSISLSYNTTGKMILPLVLSLLFLAVLVLLCIKISAKTRENAYSFLSNNKVLNTICDFVVDNRVYIYYLLTAFSVILIMFMIKNIEPFGINSFIVSDGYLQTYPMFVGLFDSLKHGDLSVLSFGTGILIDNYITIINTFACPINYIYLLFPQDATILAVSAVFATKLILSGVTMIYYLSNRVSQEKLDKHDFKLYVFGLCYGLSAFSVAYFSFGGFIDICLIFPLVIYSMELLIYKKKILPYVLILTYAMTTLVYYSFLMCEFLLLYFFMLNYKNIKDFILSGVRFGLSSILAAGLSSVVLVPFYLFTRMSPYQANDSFPAFSFANKLLTSLQDFFVIQNATLVTLNDFEANTYCGLLILLLLPLYAMNKKIPLSQRIRKLVLSALLFFSYGNEFLNFVFHGFHKQTMVPNRFSVFFIFLVISMAYDAIINIEDLSKKRILITSSVTGIILIALWTIKFIADDEPIISKTMFSNIAIVGYFVSILFILAYIIIALVNMKKSEVSTIIKKSFVALSIEIIVATLYMFTTSCGMELSYSLNDMGKINILSERNNMKDELYYTEVIGSTLSNQGYMSNINTLSTFTSTFTSSHQNMLNKWGVLNSSNFVQYETGNPLADAMLRVRYHITDKYLDDSISYYPETDVTDHLVLHENPYALPLGIYFDNSIKDWDINAIYNGTTMHLDEVSNANRNETYFDYQNRFAEYLGLDNLYDIIKFETDPKKIDENANYCLADTSNYNEDNHDIPVRVLIGTKTSGQIYLSHYNTIIYLGEAHAGVQDEFEFNLELTEADKGYLITVGILNEDVMAQIKASLSEHVMNNVTYNKNTLTGDIDLENDGMLYISLPNFDGWTAYVDGEEVEIETLLGAMGISLSKGHHNIKLVYKTAGISLGIIVSLISLIILIVVLIIIRFRTNRNIVNADDSTNKAENDIENNNNNNKANAQA